MMMKIFKLDPMMLLMLAVAFGVILTMTTQASIPSLKQGVSDVAVVTHVVANEPARKN